MKSKTSWEGSHEWYDKIVGEKGHYFHEHVILPKLLALLELPKNGHARLLDLACGQGILAKHLPEKVSYLGIDASRSLIRLAQKANQKNRTFIVADLTKPLDLQEKNFTHGAIILALQNMEDPLAVLQNASKHLDGQAKLIIVLNHPSFRIPRQSSWHIDTAKKLQYRRVDRYFSPLKIPIQTHPGQKETSTTWSFHLPLSSYSAMLKQAGFIIDEIQEWVSDKKSTGKNATMENRAREEFPLFLTIVARKN